MYELLELVALSLQDLFHLKKLNSTVVQSILGARTNYYQASSERKDGADVLVNLGQEDDNCQGD